MVGLKGPNISSNLGHRSHTKLATAKEPWSEFRRPALIPALPSSAMNVLRHLDPLVASFWNKPSFGIEVGVGLYGYRMDMAVVDIPTTTTTNERIGLGHTGDGGYGVLGEAKCGRRRQRHTHWESVSTGVEGQNFVPN